MTSLLFITPVWQRFELTEIVLRSRKYICDELAKHDIQATSVIIGNDANMKVADELGFHLVRRDNKFLSRKFNDGYEFAYAHGFDYCYPVGSDSILTADQFIDNLGNDLPMASHFYSMIHYTGKERIDVQIKVPGGIGPLIIPVSMLGKCRRPIQTDLRRGCDNAARQTILTLNNQMLTRETHQWEHVAFQSGITQITDFERIRRFYRADLYDIDFGIFREIEERYPKDILDDLFNYYESGRAENA